MDDGMDDGRKKVFQDWGREWRERRERVKSRQPGYIQDSEVSKTKRLRCLCCWLCGVDDDSGERDESVEKTWKRGRIKLL